MSWVRCRDLIMSELENIDSSHFKYLISITVLLHVPLWCICWMVVSPCKSTTNSTCSLASLSSPSLVVTLPNLYWPW
jgi:hypothetical protein